MVIIAFRSYAYAKNLYVVNFHAGILNRKLPKLKLKFKNTKSIPKSKSNFGKKSKPILKLNFNTKTALLYVLIRYTS